MIVLPTDSERYGGDAIQASELVQVLCSEAKLAPTMPFAKKALAMLWEDAIAVQSPSERPGHDAIIARNLIKVMEGLPPVP